MNVKQKVYAYITQDSRLLVFELPHAPEAGIQVPGWAEPEFPVLSADMGELLDRLKLL